MWPWIWVWWHRRILKHEVVSGLSHGVWDYGLLCRTCGKAL